MAFWYDTEILHLTFLFLTKKWLCLTHTALNMRLRNKKHLEKPDSCIPESMLTLWNGYRNLKTYARLTHGHPLPLALMLHVTLSLASKKSQTNFFFHIICVNSLEYATDNKQNRNVAMCLYRCTCTEERNKKGVICLDPWTCQIITY